MISKIKAVFGKTSTVIQNYSMVLTMSLVCSLFNIALIASPGRMDDHNFFHLKIAIVSALGISLLFALKMLSQRIGKELILNLVGIAFLILVYYLLPASEKNFTEVYAYLLIPLFLLSHILVAFIPFLDKNQELRFWRYNKNLFINIFLTAVFTGVLTGGVLLAILAIDNLFDFNFNSNYYSYTFSFLSIVGSAFIFLLFNEKGLHGLEVDGDYPVILKFFTQYILIPLLIIYVVILYFYSAKILINWELPRGWVSYLILAYSIVGILAILLVHPLKEATARSWVKIFSKAFYYTLIPLIILLFTAIFTRILEYGYTEPRYFVLLLAIWLTIVVFYFIFIPKDTIKFVPISLFAVCVFALAMPYFNAFSVANRSQKNELLQTLKEYNLLDNGKINFTKKVKSSVVSKIGDKFEFLARRNQQEFIKSIISNKIHAEIEKSIVNGNYYGVENLIQKQFSNIIPDQPLINNGYESIELSAKSSITNISEYKYLFKASKLESDSFTFDGNMLELNIFSNSETNSKYSLRLNNETVNLKPDFDQLFKDYSIDGETKVDHLFITKKIGPYEIKILFDNINKIKDNPKSDPRYLILSPSVIILIK